MAVDQGTVRRIARLARIKLADDQVPKLEGELNGILKWIEMLDEVETDGVEPMTSVVHMEMKKRDDEVAGGGDAKRVTSNAPALEDDYFMVPKVIE